MQNIKKKRFLPTVITLILAIVAIIIYLILKFSNTTQIVSGKEFNSVLKNEKVNEIYIKDNYIVATTDKKNYRVIKDAINKRELFNSYPVKLYSKSSSTLVSIAILILLAILVILIVILRRGQSQSVVNLQSQNSNKIESSEIKPEYNRNCKFKDIAGIDDVKEDILEIVDFLKHPYKYTKHNIKMPKGVLLIGPPGVGKTLIAKAISSEANVPFFYSSGANFIHIYAGMGAKRVKELFQKAKEYAPSIIFIDEIDAVGKNRDYLDNSERESTLNQLLVEMDGFSSNSGIMVIAATNRIDVLDNALLRAGRFDRKIYIELPNIKEREEIIKLYLQDKSYNIDTKEVAKLTAGFSPAAIETLINEAALNALKKKKEKIDIDDIYSVKEQVMYGKKRVRLLSNKEREIKANYQASKAIIATWLGFKIDKVSLLGQLNITQDVAVTSKSLLINKAKVLLSGILYLNSKYNNTFSISKDDKKEFEYLVEAIIKDYTILQEANKESLIKEIEIDITTTLSKLEGAIFAIAKKLNEKELVSYIELKEEIDALF